MNYSVCVCVCVPKMSYFSEYLYDQWWKYLSQTH